jgi:hypothetical protein
MSRLRRIAPRAFAIAAALALAVAAPASAERALRSAGTSLRFAPEILRDLGIALANVAPTGAPLRDGALGFAVETGASRVAFAAPGGDFESFASADLRHAGGFALRVGGAVIDLARFRLSAAALPHLLELRDRRGRRWLVVDRAHAKLDGDRLAIANADLLIAPELARAIGRPDLAWTYLGELDAELEFAGGDAAASSAPRAVGRDRRVRGQRRSARRPRDGSAHEHDAGRARARRARSDGARGDRAQSGSRRRRVVSHDRARCAGRSAPVPRDGLLPALGRRAAPDRAVRRPSTPTSP